MNTVIFEDEIVLYWDKQWELPDGVRYRITLNGKEIAITQKTHCEIIDLQSETQYAVAVERLDEKGNVMQTLYSERLQTQKKRKRIDVTKPPYNAVGDGKTLNTKALQCALNDCKAGETVYIPRGTYLTGALDMHGDTELYLEKDAILQGTKNIADYAPKRWSRFEGIEMECYAALINVGTMDHTAGYTTKNVTIRGGGMVSGGGKDLCWAVIDSERERLKEFLESKREYVKTCENDNTIPGRARPKLVSVNNAENVIFGNVTFGFGPAWNLHFVYSKNVVTYNCTIQSEGVWNGDGWDPDSSENCTIFGCTFATHDDAVAVKSGKNPEGNVINRPTKNVRIFDCHGKNGISLGSEMSGGIENVFIWDCNIFHSFTGLRIKTTRKRGGYVKNVRVRNCALADIRIWTKYYSNDDGESSGVLTELENFRLENIEIAGVSIEPDKISSVPAITIAGFDEKERYIKNVILSDIKIYKKRDDNVQKLVIENVENLTVGNISLIDNER